MIRTKKGGHLVVISGPSGVGKSTVIAEVMHQRDNLVFSVSYTTRAPRAGEEDGVNYHFVDKAEFERMIRDGELLEYTQYAGNYYARSGGHPEVCQPGTGRAAGHRGGGCVQRQAQGGQRRAHLRRPPSFEELSRRLHGRRTENEEVVRARLEKAQVELKQIPNYDYLVVNDSVIRAASDIISILNAEDCRVTKQNLKLEVD